uniref:HAD-IIIC family phosphatase n=1 Tax=Roseiarcus sp. TaxID=1969460 RepID=UPI003F95075C
MPALPIIETAEPRSTAEAIRLVIWDLDETFWKGTLTVGGIQYDEISHDIVIELSHRGIINSICSRNDFDSVAKILQERGIWDYFVFPSVDWTPKGQRIRRIVEAVQLRPETVLFIDDNPMNRAEALQAVPGLQVACENRVQELLSDPVTVHFPHFRWSREVE